MTRFVTDKDGTYDLNHVVAITSQVPATGEAAAVLHFKGHSLVTALPFKDTVKTWTGEDQLPAEHSNEGEVGHGG